MKRRIAAIVTLIFGIRLGSLAADSQPFKAFLHSTQVRQNIAAEPSQAMSAPAPADASLNSPPLTDNDNESAVVSAGSLIPESETNTLSEQSENILETTIASGLSVKNMTDYDIDIPELLSEGLSLRLNAQAPQILIIHTHSSEAYTPDGQNRYECSDTNRTEDTNFNVVHVGDELADKLQAYGLHVIHDRDIYDYPSYTGSYTRCGEAIERYLSESPEISIVIDLHRDALGSGDVIYKTVAETGGKCASQVMMLIGTDASGLYHPKWRENLKLALYLQSAAVRSCPTLVRPVSVVNERYNQHLTTGSMILEVGSAGNTLEEALNAIDLFADAVGPALKDLVEQQV